MWTVEPEWQGETVWIIGGGPSVADLDLSALQGRRVIAVNSSWAVYPAADILFFADARWWGLNRPKVEAGFSGRIATCASGTPSKRLLRLHRMDAQHGLSNIRNTVCVGRTSIQGAMNLAVHLGVSRIVLVGVDGGPDGKRTHHHEPHPWPQRPNCWGEQIANLGKTVPHLERLGVEVVNANPASQVPWWRLVPFASTTEA